MTTERPKAGLVETTITTGTGAYQLQGPLAPWRGFVAADDAKVWPYGVYQDGGGFEEGEGSYSHSARTLSRNVMANHLGTTSPVDWGSGTKEVSVVIPASRVVMTSIENRYFADQYLKAYRLYLDADEDTFASAASDDIVRFFLASMETMRLESNRLTYTWADDGAGEGPILELFRTSASPAASDNLGSIYITGKDSNGNAITVFRIHTYIGSPTPGAHNTGAVLSVSANGSIQQVMQIASGTVTTLPGINIFTNGKFSSNANTIGAELRTFGDVICVTQDAASGYFYRKGSDGLVVDIGRDGVSQGGIKCTAGVVAIEGACLSHPTEWASDVDGEAFEGLGWVVCTADGLLEDQAARHPLVQPSRVAADPCVYGVVSGRHDGKLSVEATGSGLIRCVGPIARGDLLETSDVEGAARKQADGIITSSTVAKATQSSPDDGGVRLVPCTLLAG